MTISDGSNYAVIAGVGTLLKSILKCIETKASRCQNAVWKWLLIVHQWFEPLWWRKLSWSVIPWRFSIQSSCLLGIGKLSDLENMCQLKLKHTNFKVQCSKILLHLILTNWQTVKQTKSLAHSKPFFAIQILEALHYCHILQNMVSIRCWTSIILMRNLWNVMTFNQVIK